MVYSVHTPQNSGKNFSFNIKLLVNVYELTHFNLDRHKKTFKYKLNPAKPINTNIP